VTVRPLSTPGATQTPTGPPQAFTGNGDEPGGSRLLSSDVRVAWLLLDDARCRFIERWFGVPKEDTFLVTMIGLGLVAGAVHRHAERVLRVPGGPSAPDTVIGGAVLRESMHRIAGTWSRDSSSFGTLVAIAMLGASVRPGLAASLRGIKASSHVARAGFDHRYGHLVRRNRPHR
jgi:hypothetical protein